jgi:ribosome-associated protein
MKVRVQGVKSIYISGEYIKLDALLKYASLVSSGGEAKMLIKDGLVFVDKEVCVSRGKKIKPGSVVRCGDSVLLIKQGKYDS